MFICCFKSLQENNVLCSIPKWGVYACFIRINKTVGTLGTIQVAYCKSSILISGGWKAGMAETAFEDKILVTVNNPQALILQFVQL